MRNSRIQKFFSGCLKSLCFFKFVVSFKSRFRDFFHQQKGHQIMYVIAPPKLAGCNFVTPALHKNTLI